MMSRILRRFLLLVQFGFVVAALQYNVEAQERKQNMHKTVQVQGWTLLVNRQLLTEKPELTKAMLELVDSQLKQIGDTVSEPALSELRSVRIWVNPIYQCVRPTAEYHPAAGWLRNNHRDPAMAKCVEITNVEHFQAECVRMPWLMLHELAHAWHDQVIGFNHTQVRDAYEKAKESGVYDQVDRFTGKKVIKDKAYALTNPQEYFAESTEAYFGKNDFFPFNRAELKEHDPTMHDLLQNLWNNAERSEKANSGDSDYE